MAKMNTDIEDGDHDLQLKYLQKKKIKKNNPNNPKPKPHPILKYINIWILKNKHVCKYNGKGKD